MQLKFLGILKNSKLKDIVNISRLGFLAGTDGLDLIVYLYTPFVVVFSRLRYRYTIIIKIFFVFSFVVSNC